MMAMIVMTHQNDDSGEDDKNGNDETDGNDDNDDSDKNDKDGTDGNDEDDDSDKNDKWWQWSSDWMSEWVKNVEKAPPGKKDTPFS